jgi:hypothetical protein
MIEPGLLRRAEEHIVEHNVNVLDKSEPRISPAWRSPDVVSCIEVLTQS